MASDAASSSSFGSGLSEGSEQDKNLFNKNDDENSEGSQSFLVGAFGCAYTVSKEKTPSAVFVSFRLFADWLQLFLIVVNPAYGWNISAENRWWQAFSFIQLNHFMSVRGYTFFLACMYILAVALAANVGLCVWVSRSFQMNTFNHVWPIVVLRYFSLVFYQVLDIASLTLFLMTMDCQYFSVDAAVQYHNQEFPDVYCWDMPHLIHVIVAAAAILIFFTLATAFSMAELELNPVSRNLMGMPHTRVEVLGFGIKMFMTCVSVFVPDVKWMSVLQLIASALLVLQYLTWLPHLVPWVNHVRVGSYASVMWAALLLCVMSYHPGLGDNDDAQIDKQRATFTILLWVLFIPAGLFGAFLSSRRTKYFTEDIANKFRCAPSNAKPKDIHEFHDPREVELVSRCCRVWLEKNTLDEEAAAVAERVIKAGMKQLPGDTYMAILWSSFLIDVQGSYQTGFTALQVAKRMPNSSLLERFCIFVREQEHAQKTSAANSGDAGSSDLVSYVEFQRNYRIIIHLHTEALMAKRCFWELLLHHSVAFDKVAAAVQRIEIATKAADRTYRQVLVRHSNSLKVLQLYVKFLQGVRNDPWAAARYASEVDKLQRVEEEANERAVFGGGPGDDDSNANAAAIGSMKQSVEENKAVVIIGANCLIRMINQPGAEMFGYAQRAELLGKNVNILVPPPYSKNHNQYVKTYIQTGVPRVMGKPREVVGMHKDRYVIPINLYVSKISGCGDDSTFMAVISQIPDEEDVANAWIMPGGMVLSCDGRFTDWLGYRHEDVHNRAIGDLVVEDKELNSLLLRMKREAIHGVEQTSVISKSPRPQQASILAPSSSDDNLAELELPTSYPATPVPSSPARNTRATAHNAANDAANVANTITGTSAGNGKLRLTSILPGRSKPILSSAACVTSWQLQGLHMKHLYLDDASLSVDVSISMETISDSGLLRLKLRRVCKDEGSHCILVTDTRGRVVHATTQLAQHLGSTVAKMQTGGTLHALDSMLPLPYMKMHHLYMRNDLTDSPPPYSCRSGLSMCLTSAAAQGTGPAAINYKAFSMDFQRKMLPGRDPLTVVLMKPKTMEQALDERRLSLTISQNGIVIDASGSPFNLFGVEPSALVGTHMCHILDILTEPFMVNRKQDALTDIEAEEAATTLLMIMAQRSYESPGMSWRVGVAPAVETSALLALGPIATAMVQQEKVPAVMTLRPYLAASTIEGTRRVLPSEMQLKVELWRSDLLSGVLEVDSQGHVTGLGIKGHPGLEPHLLLGLPHALMKGATLSSLIPIQGKHLAEALFTEGSQATTLVTGNASGRLCPGGVPLKGAMKNSACQTFRRRGVGPVHVIHMLHATDGMDVDVQVQAVVKQEHGTSCSMYLHLHLATPQCGRPDFAGWLPSSLKPGLVNARMTRRNSTLRGPQDSQNAVLPVAIPAAPMILPKPPFENYLQGGAKFALPAPTPTAVTRRRSLERAVDNARDNASNGDVAPTHPDAADAELAKLLGLSLMPGQVPSSKVMLPAVSYSNGKAVDVQGTRSSGVTPGTPPKHSSSRHEPDSGVSQPFHQPAGEADSESGRHSLVREESRIPDDDEKRRNKDKIRHWMQSNAQGEVKPAVGANMHLNSALYAAAAPATTAAHAQQPQCDNMQWSASQVEQPDAPADAIDDEVDDGAENDNDDVNAGGDDGVADEDGDAAAELDEANANAGVIDLKRGKRLKRLVKMLMSPQAQAPNTRLKWVSIGAVIVLIAVDLAMFMAFMQLVNVQMGQVDDLRSSTKAVNRVINLATAASGLQILYGGEGRPQLRYLGTNGAEWCIQNTLAKMEVMVHELETVHKGVYRGFNKVRQLPHEYGLRDLWETASVTVRLFLPSESGPTAMNQNMSLFDAGSIYIKSVQNILQTSELLYDVENTNNSLAFVNNTDVLYLMYNGPRSIMTAYQQTLDGLMQKCVDDSNKMNSIQLIILAIEGGFVGTLTVVVMWVVTQQAVMRRFSVFAVFMTVPSGVLRALATVPFNLEEGEEEDVNGDDEVQQQSGQGDPFGSGHDFEAGNGSGDIGGAGIFAPGPDRSTADRAAGGKAQVSIAGVANKDPSAGGAGTGNAITATNHNTGILSSLLGRLSFWKPPVNARRHLRPSLKPVLWLTWPFVLWAVFVVIINAIGYIALKDMKEPIALSNIVQFLSIRINRLVYFTIRLGSGQYFDSTLSFIIATDADMVTYYQTMQPFRNTLVNDFDDLQLEYTAALFGGTDPTVTTMGGDEVLSNPHFQLSNQGIAFSQGAELMYNFKGCLAADRVDCQPVDSPFYRHTTRGLEQMLKEFFYRITVLISMPDHLISLDAEPIKYIYEVGSADLRGGMSKLNDVYYQYVQNTYQSALVLHIVAFAMCCGMGLMFLVLIMQPNNKRLTSESRRVAELLAFLPPETNVEQQITQALQINSASNAAVSATTDANGNAAMSDLKSRRLSVDASITGYGSTKAPNMGLGDANNVGKMGGSMANSKRTMFM